MKPSVKDLQDELLSAIDDMAVKSQALGYHSAKWVQEENNRTYLLARKRVIEAVQSLTSPLVKYESFYESISCLFYEGPEFMDKVQLYDAFKAEFLKLKEKIK